MSEDEEAAESADDVFFFAAAAPGVATTVSMAAPPKAAEDHAMDFGMERESAVAPAEPRFDAVEVNREHAPPPRDYAADFNEVARGGPDQAEPGAQASRRCFLNPAGSRNAISMFPRFCAGCSFRKGSGRTIPKWEKNGIVSKNASKVIPGTSEVTRIFFLGLN